MTDAVKFYEAARRGELAPGGTLRVVVQGREIALYDVGGEVFATDDICTHAYASLADGVLEHGVIECPLHAGRFDVRTGRALSPPVTEDVRCYPVKVDGGTIYVALPEGDGPTGPRQN